MSALSKEAAVSAAWHAMKSLAGKCCRRELLEGPASCKVDLVVAGRVAGQQIEMPVAGDLKVNPDGVQVSSSKPATNDVLALLLARLTPRVRASLVAQTLAHFAEHRELPAADRKMAELATSFMEQLRTRKEEPKKGTVSFIPSA